jgi:hypothetical protein
MVESNSARPIMTVLEARVEPDRWAALQGSYDAATGQLPSQMKDTFPVQSTADPAIWRVISVWRSRGALEEYRRSVATPGGVLIFRAAGAEPSVAILEVVANVRGNQL